MPSSSHMATPADDARHSPGPHSLRDGFTRYRYGDRVGYGILEHGYVERDDD